VCGRWLSVVWKDWEPYLICIVWVLSLIVRCVARLRTLPNMYCLCVVVDCPLCCKIENPTQYVLFGCCRWLSVVWKDWEPYPICIVWVWSLIVRCVARLRTLPNMYCLGVVVDCPLCGKIENPTQYVLFGCCRWLSVVWKDWEPYLICIVCVWSLIVRCVERLRTLPNMYCLGVVVDCPLCGKIENPT
jgi:hypothetical protein